MKKALILTTVSGFLLKFELQNVKILQKMGYEVHYAANADQKVYEFDTDELKRQGIYFHPVAISKSPFDISVNKKALKQIEQILRTEQIDLIHCHTPVGGLLGRLAGHHIKERDVKVIYTAHGFHFYKGCPAKDYIIYHTVEKLLARYTDAIVLINREDYDSASAFHLKRNGKVYQIPGAGLNRDTFSPASDTERANVRKQLGITDDMILLLSAGELNENKNYKVILDMLCRMKERGDDLSRIKYIICGDGPDREKLQQDIIRRDLQQTVSLEGYIRFPAPYYNAADLLLFPTRREGLGMSALEALSCATPVIAADNRGTREYMQPGKNGYVCRWNVPEDYLSAFDQWRSLSETESLQLRKNCRDSVEKFDLKYTAQIMQQVYESI